MSKPGGNAAKKPKVEGNKQNHRGHPSRFRLARAIPLAISAALAVTIAGGLQFLPKIDTPVQSVTVARQAGDAVRIERDLVVTSGALSTTDTASEWTRNNAPAYPAGRNSLADVVLWAAHESGRELIYDQPMTQLRAQTEIVKWPMIPAAALEQILVELDATTSDFAISFTPSELRVSHR